ncbi:MAG: transporter substrate-binding domain-containing protein [Deltaproteobacteria bacterium]|nr:transporter substrate-binding domain-containing protein [Deltaproteobacteria bacterium]
MRKKDRKLKSNCIAWIAAVLLGIAAIFTYSIPAFAGETNTTSRETIRSGAEVDYPPFSFVDEHGKADGFSVELMRAALAAMGRDVVFRTGPWVEVRGWLEQAEIDALPLVGRTPEREALFDFTVPYMALHGAIVVRDNETGIIDLADLRGRKVAVMRGDNAEEFLRREDRGIEIYTTPTFEIALRELSEGRYDAVVAQRLVALRLIRKTGLTDLRVIDRPIEGFKQDFCFAVHEGDREILALLNEGLAIVVADGTYRHLHSKWFAAMQLPSDRPIVVGGDRNFPPYEFLDENGHPTGYNVDLTRAIAREMGLNIEIRLGRWTERLQALENGGIDVMQGMFYSPERDLKFDFAQPHTVSHYVAVVRKGEGPAPESVEDLKGKRIVVEQGDILHGFAAENGLEEQVVTVADQEEALRELRDGKHDCALVSLITAHYLMDKNEWSNLVHGKKPILSPEYCYASSKGQKALLAQFSEGLKALESSGEYRQIYDKWLGVYKEGSTSLMAALKYSAIIIIPLLVFAILAVAWSWSLRRQVAQKTKALQESLDRFKYVFEASNVGKSITLPTGEVNTNKAFADLLGYTRDELKGKRWQDLTPVEDIEESENIIGPLLAGEKSADRFEKRYVHKNGNFLWADVSVAMHRDAQGKPLYFITTIVDINARKQAEESLRNSEEYQRAMIACSPVALYTIDLDGNVLSWNASSEKIFGWRVEEIIGKPLPIVPADKRHEFDALRERVQKDDVFFGKELMRLKNDGSLIPISLSVAPVRNDKGEVVGILSAAEDITERKRALARIEHLNQVLRAIRDINQLIVREREMQNLIKEGCRLLVANRGYPSAMIVLTDHKDRPFAWAMEGLAAASKELAGKLEDGSLPPCCQPAGFERDVFLVEEKQAVCVKCPIAETCSESQSVCAPLIHEKENFGYVVLAAEKELEVDEEERSLFTEMAGDLAYAISVMKIEEARKQGEAALHESESRFRLFAELAPVGIVISDEEEKTLYTNSKFTELFGYTIDDMPYAEDWWKLAYPDGTIRTRVQQEWKAAMEITKKTRAEITPMEHPVTCKDGSVRHIDFRMATTGNLNIIVFNDITKRKESEIEHEKLQSQLLQAQKMESVGRLAGGVAHDYNNMLSVITGYAELAIDKIAPEDPLQADLQEILSAARRSVDITRQLLAFARQQTIDPKVLDLNETVESMLKLLRRLIGEDIDLSWEPGPGLWPVKIDPSQLDQILANLCVNARDAISDVGKITIETDNVYFDKEYCEDHAGFIPGEYVLLAVSDDGRGMDKKTLDRIFEPFFTTKDVGKGTGLGLPMIYGIVKQNEGFINVYSEPEKGTTFRIYFPRDAEAPRRIETDMAEEIPLGSGETVLIVEDEVSILKLTQIILERFGYKVLATPNPQEAMIRVKEHPGEVHLLITDVVMPEMNGRDLAEKLLIEYPNLKILFMSGYTANVIAHRGVLDEGVHFIQKPFSNRDFAVKVCEALEK